MFGIVITSILFQTVSCFQDTNWAFHFPQRTGMGVFLALAVPIELSDKNVYLSYNFEANYPVPDNVSRTVEFPPKIDDEQESRASQLNRVLAYKIIESKMNSHGFPGRICLLRMICEMAGSNFASSGILGDLLQIILTPSSSNDNILSDYFEAEIRGKEQKDCGKYQRNCKTNFLDYITK